MILKTNYQSQEEGFGEKIGIIAAIFGCWHKKLSRPFTADKISYRACLDCGARQKFDAQALKTSRKFYYPPIIRRLV